MCLFFDSNLLNITCIVYFSSMCNKYSKLKNLILGNGPYFTFLLVLLFPVAQKKHVQAFTLIVLVVLCEEESKLVDTIGLMTKLNKIDKKQE